MLQDDAFPAGDCGTYSRYLSHVELFIRAHRPGLCLGPDKRWGALRTPTPGGEAQATQAASAHRPVLQRPNSRATPLQGTLGVTPDGLVHPVVSGSRGTIAVKVRGGLRRPHPRRRVLKPSRLPLWPALLHAVGVRITGQPVAPQGTLSPCLSHMVQVSGVVH